MKNFKINKTAYSIGFIFVTFINVSLIIFLIQNILAQTTDDKFKNQSSIIVETVKQTDSPLLITIINVDNSNPNYQQVNYSVQNISNTPIKSFVIWGKGKNTGKIITDFLPTNFQVNSVLTGEIFVERENIKSDEDLLVSVDYVRFSDGKSWGKDYQQQSEFIDGAIAGEGFAIEQVKKMIENNQITVLEATLEKPLVEVKFDIPDRFKDKSEKWQKGFGNGYKGIIKSLKNLDKKESKKLLEKLDSLQKNTEMGRRQKQ